MQPLEELKKAGSSEIAALLEGRGVQAAPLCHRSFVTVSDIAPHWAEVAVRYGQPIDPCVWLADPIPLSHPALSCGSHDPWAPLKRRASGDEITSRMRQRVNKRGRLKRFREVRHVLEERRQDLSRQVLVKMRDVRASAEKDRHASLEEHFGSMVDLEAALAQMKSDMLVKVETALRLIDEGRYGICGECGGEISQLRLRALPFALRCAKCQQEREQKISVDRRYSERRISD